MQWRLAIFGPHIDDGGYVVYVWFLYSHTMKAVHIWSIHWRWTVGSVCVVSILPYNESWPYLVHTLMMEGVRCMCGFYIAIQWRLTIFGPHIDDGGCAVYVWFLYFLFSINLEVKLKTRWAITGSWEPLYIVFSYWSISKTAFPLKLLGQMIWNLVESIYGRSIEIAHYVLIR